MHVETRTRVSAAVYMHERVRIRYETPWTERVHLWFSLLLIGALDCNGILQAAIHQLLLLCFGIQESMWTADIARPIDEPVVHRRKLCSDEVLCSSEGLATFQSVHVTHTLFTLWIGWCIVKQISHELWSCGRFLVQTFRRFLL